VSPSATRTRNAEKAGGQPTFRAASPTDLLPRLLGQQLFGGEGIAVGDVMLARPGVPRNREIIATTTGYTFRRPGTPTAQDRPRSLSAWRKSGSTP